MERLAKERRDVADDLEGLLQSSEKLLWTGAPVSGFRLRGRALIQVIIGLPFFCIGVIILIVGPGFVERPADTVGSAIFVASFGGFGGYLIFDSIIKARITSRHVRYALTTRAAFVAKDWPVRKTEVFPILPLSAVTLDTGGRVATVWFHTRKEEGPERDIVKSRIGFEHISDGAKVFRLIRAIQTGGTV